jgi:hypothetical protein
MGLAASVYSCSPEGRKEVEEVENEEGDEESEESG